MWLEVSIKTYQTYFDYYGYLIMELNFYDIVYYLVFQLDFASCHFMHENLSHRAFLLYVRCIFTMEVFEFY